MNDRIEAAAELRRVSYNERELNNEPNPKLTDGGNVMWHIIDAIGCFKVSDYVGYTRAVRRLADFIDPTCYLEYREWIPSGEDECDLERDWRCSNCNHDLMEHYEDLNVKTYEELGLLYCPHCGARIIGTRYGEDNNSER